MTSNDPHAPKAGYNFIEDGAKPGVAVYAKNLNFRPNDDVYVLRNTGAREGPYTVSSIEGGKYVLRDANGNKVDGGKAFEEDELELDDPLA